MSNNLSGNNTPRGLTVYIKGFVLEIVITALLIVVFALIMNFSGAAFKYAAVFATLSLAAGSFAAALFTSAKIGNKGWLTGLIIGGITFAAVTLAALIINKGGVTQNTLFRFIIIMLSSLIGGVMGVNKGNKHKYI